ncbi:chemotaxis protein CheB [Egicoccus sp. AB-alg2]|uniref:chemotaxis protein CheB n=1 Tax=Egicoccus sp. AB-alg2 TaxID=3242693 RepID=UPI00359E0DCC
MDTPFAAGPVVALVGSAGGLPQVRQVLADLPAGLEVAVLVLLHQQPERENQLAQLLQRGCALPVQPAGDGEPLHGGAVTVAPPGRHLVIAPDGCLAMIRSGPFPPSRPSADLLLTSMGLGLGERAVAVILSGDGNDGATGAAVVRRFGGRVVTIEPRAADHPSMPRAVIERGMVDEVLPLAVIGDWIAGRAAA